MRRIIMTMIFVGLCVLGAAYVAAQPAAPRSTASPAASAQAFYRWYLSELSDQRQPLDAHGKIDAYVSRALLQDIRKRAASPDGLDQDYFIQAQDFLEDWPSHVATADERISGNAASVRVVLGATAQTRHALNVGLIKRQGDWKIRTVGPGPD